jgi:hypothetical protein
MRTEIPEEVTELIEFSKQEGFLSLVSPRFKKAVLWLIQNIEVKP